MKRIEVFDLNTNSFVASKSVHLSYDNGQQMAIVDSSLYLLSPNDDSITELIKFDITGLYFFAKATFINKSYSLAISSL